MNNNLAAVTAMYDAFGKGDIPALLTYVADDVQWEQWADNSAQKAGVPWMLARHGKEGAAAFFGVVGSLDIKEFTVLSIMGNDRQVAAEFVIEAEIRGSGNGYRDEEMHLWTFNEDGKVSRVRHYLDTAKHITMSKNNG